MALLERDSALAALAEYAIDAGAGYGRLVLVAGEAGAGKSALVEEFQRRLPDPDWFWSGCDGCPRRACSGRCSTGLRYRYHHVSAVLAKLGTPTRAEAWAEAARRGLVGTR